MVRTVIRRRCRCLLLAALLAVGLVPAAEAREAEPRAAFSFSFEEEPRAGVSVRLTAVAEVAQDGDAYRLHVTQGVQVEGDPEWRLGTGSGERHTWQVTVPRPMFWTAALYPKRGHEDLGLPGPCCLYVWTGSDGAAWDLEALSPDRARITFTGDGTAEWWPLVGPESVVVPIDIQTPFEERGLGARPGETPPGRTLELDLRDGGRHDLSVAVTWGFLFDAPAPEPGWALTAPPGNRWLSGEAYCRSHVLERHGDRLELDEGERCPARMDTPGAPPALVGLVLLACLQVRRAWAHRRGRLAV